MWSQEFLRSIKSPDAEDRFDLVFYRPLGFLVAKLSWATGLHPTHVTLLGAASGLAAGYFFYVGTGPAFFAAVLLFLLAGILDSADGQLARLSGRSTPFGLVLDGLCDNIVFGAVYVGCSIPLMAEHGWSVWALAVAAGFSHSLQSSTLDFYNREYLFYTSNAGRERYWNPLLSELECQSGWASRLRATWLWQQEMLSVRTPKQRLALKSVEHPGLSAMYRRYNHHLLHLWRPLGANVHTAAIIFFAWFRRFDLYLILVDIVALNLWLSASCWAQRWSDQAMLAELGIAPDPAVA